MSPPLLHCNVLSLLHALPPLLNVPVNSWHKLRRAHIIFGFVIKGTVPTDDEGTGPRSQESYWSYVDSLEWCVRVWLDTGRQWRIWDKKVAYISSTSVDPNTYLPKLRRRKSSACTKVHLARWIGPSSAWLTIDWGYFVIPIENFELDFQTPSERVKEYVNQDRQRIRWLGLCLWLLLTGVRTSITRCTRSLGRLICTSNLQGSENNEHFFLHLSFCHGLVTFFVVCVMLLSFCFYDILIKAPFRDFAFLVQNESES